MSGIAGIIHFDGAPVEPGQIESMTAAMKRRGPDEQTHWAQGSVALGHCMLRTTPESIGEHQPLPSQDRSLVLVWDGRLDNRADLRRNLLATGAILRNNSDAELALQSYAAWGEEFPKHLLGDFACAVWDARRNRLFCARDHLGARPIYFTHNDRFLGFASEEEALLELPGVSACPNEEQIAGVLVPALQSFENPHSFLQDVRGLSPGQRMVVFPNGSRRIDTYWQPTAGEESSFSSDQECEEAFLAVFGDAVRARMRVIGQPAAMMSGGMDSASIAAMARRLLPDMCDKRLHTYSAIADAPANCVESQCILSLTNDLGSDAHYVSVPSFNGMASVEDLIDVAWSEPHPLDNSILLPATMCLAASRRNDRVMLHGCSGDLTMYSPIYYATHLLRAKQWQEAWQECKDASRNNTYLRGSSPTSILRRNAETAYAPGVLEPLKSPVRRLLRRTPLARSAINPCLARKLLVEERLRGQMAEERRHSSDTHQQAHARLLASLSRGPVLGLAGYERVAGRYGVELRDPWSDRRVVEFFLRLPLKYKVRQGWTKYVARTAFKADLGENVRTRLGKEHLGWQFTARLMEETGDFVTQLLENDLDKAAAYVDVKTVRNRLHRYRQRPESGPDRQFIFEIATLVGWIRGLSSK